MLRNIDGVEIEMTPEEVAAVQTEWAAFVPPVVDPLRNLEPDQFHSMLNLSGYLPDIEAFLSSIVDDPQFVASARAKLGFAKYYVRLDPLVVGIATGLGIEASMMDAMWAQAHDF